MNPERAHVFARFVCDAVVLTLSIMLCQTVSSRWPSVLKHPMRLMHVFLPVFSKFEHELLHHIMQAWASPQAIARTHS